MVNVKNKKNKGNKNANTQSKGKEKETEAGKKEPEKEVDVLPSKEDTDEARKLAAEAKPVYEKNTYKVLIDNAFEAGNNHEEVEDELIAKGYSYDLYSEYLNDKYKKKVEKDGSNFLDDGEVPDSNLPTDREKEDADKLAKLEAESLAKINAAFKAANAIDEEEKDKDQFEKSFSMPGQTHDNSKETKNPIPRKYREAAVEGSGTKGYTIWHCPECNGKCVQEKHKWVCTSNSCLYGKPKPRPEDQIAKEIIQYKLLLPDLGVSVHRVKMSHAGNGRYTIVKGQEKDIARQVIKILNNKTWKKLTANQIMYMAENDKTKGINV